MGIHPEEFSLNQRLQERISRLFKRSQIVRSASTLPRTGIRRCHGFKPKWLSNQNTATLRQKQAILSQLLMTLYRFLNPITGGSEGKGWPLGQPVYPSDVAALLQQVPGIRYLGAIQLLELRREGQHWTRMPPAAVINPGPLGVVCFLGRL